MIDIKIVRENPELLKDALQRRNMDTAVVGQLAQLDETWRAKLTRVEELKAERNAVSKEIGAIKDKTEREGKIVEMRKVGDQISAMDEEVKAIEQQLQDLIATVPNLVDASVPLGPDESGNVVTRVVGEKPQYDFEPQPHWELGPKLGIIDFDQGVKITGSRFLRAERRRRAPAARLDRLDAGPARAPRLSGKIPALHGQGRNLVCFRAAPQVCR